MSHIFYAFDDETKLRAFSAEGLLEKEDDLFERDYCLIALGRKPNFLAKALEKELRLS